MLTLRRAPDVTATLVRKIHSLPGQHLLGESRCDLLHGVPCWEHQYGRLDDVRVRQRLCQLGQWRLARLQRYVFAQRGSWSSPTEQLMRVVQSAHGLPSSSPSPGNARACGRCTMTACAAGSYSVLGAPCSGASVKRRGMGHHPTPFRANQFAAPSKAVMVARRTTASGRLPRRLVQRGTGVCMQCVPELQHQRGQRIHLHLPSRLLEQRLWRLPYVHEYVGGVRAQSTNRRARQTSA